MIYSEGFVTIYSCSPSKSMTIGTLLENLVDRSSTASLADFAVVVVAIVLVSHI